MPHELSDLAQKLSAPISSAAPTGEDPKYLAEYEFVKGEIAKTSERDWEAIEAQCTTVIATHAKDITVLSFGILASAMQSGWGGSASWAQASLALMRDHWDALHPARERARINSLKWLTDERVLGTFSQVETTPDDAAHLERLIEALDGLRILVGEKLPADTPSIKPLIALAQERLKSVAVAAPKAPPPSPTPSVASTSTAAPAASSEAPGVSLEGSKTDLLRGLQKIALHLVSTEPDGAFGYKLLRMVRWQEITMPPKSDNEKKTPFPAPNKQRMAFFENAIKQESWAQILEKSEAAFTEPGGQFWLDLQFAAHKALVGKGLSACASTVEKELVALLDRVPQLPQYRFQDGTPFATGPVQEWLEGLAAASKGGGGAAPKSNVFREDTLVLDQEQALALSAKGDTEGAIGLLQSGLVYGNRRQRCERQLAIANLAYSAGKALLTESLCADLAQTIQSQNLAEWDPEFCSAVYLLRTKSLNALLAESKEPESTQIRIRRDENYAFLGKIDPGSALRVQI